MVRPAAFGDEQAIAELLHGKAGGKSHPRICRRRAHECVMRSRKWKQSSKVYCLVSEDERDVIGGFLYAQEVEAFELCAKIVFLEVIFLVGTACAVALLRDLRARSRRRIHVPAWASLTPLRAFERLLAPLEPRLVGAVYEV